MPRAPMVRMATDTMAAGLTRRRARRCRLAGRVVRAPTAIVLLIVNPRSSDTELDERRAEDDEEQRDGDGRGVADLEVGERLLGEVHHDAAGGVARAAVGQ